MCAQGFALRVREKENWPGRGCGTASRSSHAAQCDQHRRVLRIINCYDCAQLLLLLSLRRAYYIFSVPPLVCELDPRLGVDRLYTRGEIFFFLVCWVVYFPCVLFCVFWLLSEFVFLFRLAPPIWLG